MMQQPNDSDRWKAGVVIISIGVIVMLFAHSQFWKIEQNRILFEFSMQHKEALVPVPCKDSLGQRGVDFVRASARSVFGYSKSHPSHIDACWYPIERYMDLYAVPSLTDVADIISNLYRAMDLKPLALRTPRQNYWLVVGIPIGLLFICIGVAIFVVRGTAYEEPDTSALSVVSTIDKKQLQNDLQRLRKNLGS